MYPQTYVNLVLAVQLWLQLFAETLYTRIIVVFVISCIIFLYMSKFLCPVLLIQHPYYHWTMEMHLRVLHLCIITPDILQIISETYELLILKTPTWFYIHYVTKTHLFYLKKTNDEVGFSYYLILSVNTKPRRTLLCWNEDGLFITSQKWMEGDETCSIQS